jgi:TetR/AcrR family transcriptional regulator, cholesterol catabolism regulator
VKCVTIFAAAMEEKLEKIVEAAGKVFMRLGIKSVNMDDMARHLGISKKTLYLYVKDKEDLVKRTVSSFCDNEDKQIKAICTKGLNAIDESLEIMKWVSMMLHQMHPSVAYDMEKYHPEIYHDMWDNRQKFILNCILDNLKKGQKEGLYRKDFNADVVSKLYIGRMNVMFDQRLFPQQEYSLSDLYLELFTYHIRGIASPKGLEMLEAKMKTKKKN